MQWLMLQQNEPQDFVIATGRQASVRKFLELSALELGWGDKNNQPIIWSGEGIDEIGRRSDNGEVVVKIDPRYFRPTEVETLLGDPSKAEIKLGWKPKTSLEELVTEMIAFDVEEAKKESLLKSKGYKINSPLESPPGK